MVESRKLVIHHDDLGGSRSANAAFVELVDSGIVTCGSVMVPAPQFVEMVHIAENRPNLDIGVHLTLMSEFPDHRWGPLTSGASLVDGDGFFWPDNASERAADPEEVRVELITQIELALTSGIDVTHLDSHMGTVWQPEFIDIYLELGETFRLPIVVTQDVSKLSAPHSGLANVFARLQENQHPTFQRFLTTPFGNPAPGMKEYEAIFSEADEGLNWCGFHFAVSGYIESMTADAETRIAEYNLFRSAEISTYLETEGFELVGMRMFRERMRS